MEQIKIDLSKIRQYGIEFTVLLATINWYHQTYYPLQAYCLLDCEFLSDILSVHRTTIARWIDKLEEAEIIKLQRRKYKKGKDRVFIQVIDEEDSFE